MKTILLSLALTICTVAAWAQTEEEQVKDVINKSYVQGIHNFGDIAQIEKGFHPGFEMIMVRENVLSKLPIYTWLENIRTGREKNPTPPAEKTDVKYISVDVTGKAASVKLELYRGGKLIFTDYLLLYKFDREGWRIVSKTFERH